MCAVEIEIKLHLRVIVLLRIVLRWLTPILKQYCLFKSLICSIYEATKNYSMTKKSREPRDNILKSLFGTNV